MDDWARDFAIWRLEFDRLASLARTIVISRFNFWKYAVLENQILKRWLPKLKKNEKKSKKIKKNQKNVSEFVGNFKVGTTNDLAEFSMITYVYT